MASKRTVTTSAAKIKAKRSRKSLSLEKKLQIVKRHEGGEGTNSIARFLQLPQSTVSTVIKQAASVKKAGETVSTLMAKTLTRQREPIMEEMERLLRQWIDDQTHRRMPLSTSLVTTKALSIYADLQKKGYEVKEGSTFSASKGWFDRFKTRATLHIKMRDGEGATSADDITKRFLEESYKKKPVEPTSSVPSPSPNVEDEKTAFSDLYASSAEESDIVKEEPELVPSPSTSHETYMKEDAFHSAARQSFDPECDNRSLKWNQDFFMECNNDPLETSNQLQEASDNDPLDTNNQLQEANGVYMETQEDETNIQAQATRAPDISPPSLTCPAPTTLERCLTVKGQHSQVGSSTSTASSGANDDTEDGPQLFCRKRRQTTKLTPEQERDMVEWLQDHPLFYNKKLSDYTNVAMKKYLLEQKAHELNTYVNKLQTWKDEMKVRFECLFKRSKEGDKSKFSQRDKWIYNNFQFLQEHLESPTSKSRTCDISLHRPSSSTGRASAAGLEQQTFEEQLVHDLSPQAEEVLLSTPTAMISKDRNKLLEIPVTAELLQKLHEQHDRTNALQSQVASLLHPRSSHVRQVAQFMGYLASLCETMTTPAWRLFEKEVQAFAHDLISNPPTEPLPISGSTPRTLQRP